MEIREIRKDEYKYLEDFLYDAIFQRDGNNLLPKEVIKEPQLNVYIKDFGQYSDDKCYVACDNGKLVGGVWTRVIDGFGSIDNNTPEFAISVNKEYRNKGIGRLLMNTMLEYLADNEYRQVSLAVQKDNYAFKLYKSLGFEIIDENDQEYIMLYKFK